MTKVKSNISQNTKNKESNIHPEVEYKFKLLLKIMSWVVGVSFVLIIILPLIESTFVDDLVKVLYYIGLINLILFAILEFFAQNIKIILSRNRL